MKRICLIAAVLILGGSCSRPGGDTGKKRDTSTLLNALIGSWHDEKVGGWREYFSAAGRYAITVEGDIFYGGGFGIEEEVPATRSLKLLLTGDGDSEGSELRIEGTFSPDYREFAGSLAESAAGGPFTAPRPFRWLYESAQETP